MLDGVFFMKRPLCTPEASARAMENHFSTGDYGIPGFIAKHCYWPDLETSYQ
jgi:hypothetical protein